MSIDNLLSKAWSTWRVNASEGRRMFQELLNDYPEHKLNILRQRSHGNVLDARYDLAFADRLVIIESGTYQIGDLFMISIYALKADLNIDALIYIEKCISESIEADDHYYLESAQLIAALCHARLGNEATTRAWLDKLEDDESIPWFHGLHREITKEVVLGELFRQLKSR